MTLSNDGIDRQQPTEAGSRDEHAELLRALMATPTWCAGPVKFEEGILSLEGWALPLADDPAGAGIAVNGRLMKCDTWATYRADIENLYWQWPGAAMSGFQVSLPISRNDLFSDGYFTLEYVDGRSGRVINSRHNVYFPSDKLSTSPLPDAARQRRVQGVGDDSIFLMEGFSAFKKIVDSLQARSGWRRRRLGSVLDWGCGCGRLTRYFQGDKRLRISGTDIDVDNVEWCSRSLPFGKFVTAPLSPPCEGLPTKAFDTIIGMSVMTHLSEPDQDRWLDELARVSKPRALVALSVHGGATIARSNLPLELFSHWLTLGYLDGGMNPDLIGAIERPEFYRNAFHSEKYIRERWSKHFDVVDYIPAFIGNHHDLVVLQRQ